MDSNMHQEPNSQEVNPISKVGIDQTKPNEAYEGHKASSTPVAKTAKKVSEQSNTAAIVGTVLIVVALSTLATYAYIKTKQNFYSLGTIKLNKDVI